MKVRQPHDMHPEPGTPEEWFKRGISHMENGDYAAAEQCFRKTRCMAPGSMETLLNLGYALDKQGRSEEALNCYEEVLTLSPGNAKARYNRAMHLLRKGDLAAGFADYEARFAAMKNADSRAYPQPRWDGSPLYGRSILIYCEQGLGDAVMFIRYIPLVAGMGGRILLEAQEPLVTLFSSLPGIEKVVAKSPIPPATGVHIPLLSLPHIFGTTLDTIPAAPMPYLAPDASKVTDWHCLLSDDARYRVGLAWRGSATNPMDRDRSCPLAEFAPLLAIPGISCYSLQLGPAAGEIASLADTGTLEDLTGHLADFSDTAALICNLDLVVTVDTAVAHLAGALGKPVFLLLAHTPDWRWMLDRPDSPWYPTMRLFRQPTPGDWGSVVKEIHAALQQRLSPETVTAVPAAGSTECILANALSAIEKNDSGTAISLLKPLLATEPDEPAIWFNLGWAYDMAGQLPEARSCYQQALRLQPNSAPVWHAIGNIHLKRKSFPEAEACLHKAHEQSPESVEILFDLGAALVQQDKVAEAFECCRRILEIDPGNRLAVYNRAYLRLRSGDYAAGFADFEARLEVERFRIDQRTYPQPRWDGSPLDGKSILVFGEQGMGDVIQFSRYLPMLAERGGRVILEVDPPLIPLFKPFPGVCQIVPKSSTPPVTDLYIHLLSLPHIFGTTVETVPDKVPYIYPEREKLVEWQQLLAETPGPRVGMVWRGSPNNPIDRERSCPLSVFAPLADVPGVTFFSLQVGEATDETTSPSGAIRLIDHTGRLNDFADTAAFIANLDLVIGVDTAVTHLAGALGKPVWVMLPHIYDWRWIAGREESPWYPTARLFWQERHGDWAGTISRVQAALVQWTEQRIEEDGFGDIETCYSLGAKLKEEGDLTGAERCFRWIIAREPGLPDPQHSLGVVLHMQERPREAIEYYRNATSLDPDFAQAHYNLANALLVCGRHAEAIESVHSALACNDGYADAHWLLGMLLLQSGDFSEGWKEYEWRWQAKAFKAKLPDLGRPQWDGAPIQGKTILVRMEQGRGDMIQFVRYAPILASMGARVIVSATPELQSLLSTVPGVGRVFDQHGILPEFDIHVPLLSLPHILGTTLDTIPASIPYLRPDADKVFEWNRILPPGGTLRVGLVWQGSTAHRDDRNRSCPLNEFLALADMPGVTLFSLQIGQGSEQLMALPPSVRICDLTGRIRDFSDTAALLTHIDLVICVDTAIAHLAGALGRQVWTLLPFVPDWRWMLDREDTPWYPGMRLFRQASPGDWHKVFERVRSELAALAKEAGDLKQRGIILLQSGDAPGAERLFAAAAELNPEDEQAYSNRGVALDALDRFEEAIDCYDRALSINPDFLQAYLNKGNALLSLFRLDEARDCFERAIELNPEFVPAYLSLGEIAKSQKDYPLARKNFSTAALLAPSNTEAFQGIAETCQAEERFEEAIDAYRQVLTLDPERVNTLNLIGTAFQSLERPDEAETFYRRALALAPDRSTIANNLGAVLTAQERHEEAIAVFRHLLEIDPDYAEAHWNLSMALLATGEYAEGWTEYEWRFKKTQPVAERKFSQPRWDGSPLYGKTILLHCEQGFGDTLQFARYAPLVAKLGGRVIIECQVPALKRILSSLEGVAEVTVAGSPLPEFDFHLPLLSLPLAFATTIDTIPAQVPYIAPSPELVREWALRIPQSRSFKVGLVWFGRQSLVLNRKRSCPLETFSPLADLPGVEFYSLQIGEGVDQLAQDIGFKISDLTPLISDFADTAALISHLDLVITIDTAVAHLAGAIGAKTWVLVPYGADWRWMKNRTDSPWYPTMRLFRQTSPRDWASVMLSVGDALQKCVNAGATAGSGKETPSALPETVKGKCGARMWSHGANSGLRVGLAWSCRQDNPVTRTRACPFSALAPLFRLPGIAYYATQPGVPIESNSRLPLIDLTAHIKDFEDTAALISNLDLLITVDTSVAHLAGALGRKAWVLLPHAADWRWLQNREDSPWYPDLRLFRQPEHGDWNSVISRIACELSKMTGISTSETMHPIATADSEPTDERRRLEELLSHHLHSLQDNPDAATYLDAGAALALLGRNEDAEPYLRKVIQLDPDNLSGHLNLAYSLLSRGKYAEGWQHFEWRLKRIQPGVLPPWPLLSRETLGKHRKGASVLVHCEQGLGDTIQFARFLPILAAFSYDVAVSCPPSLAALASSAKGVKMAVSHGESLPTCDLQTMLLSLPHLLKIGMGNLPATTPYLIPGSSKIIEWKQKMDIRFG